MHELGITQEVVAIVSDRANGRSVRRVTLEVGKLTAVLPDAVAFCWNLCTEGTPAEGATLEIRETPGSARCESCGSELELDQPFGACDCGSTDLKWLTGDELRISEVELI